MGHIAFDYHKRPQGSGAYILQRIDGMTDEEFHSQYGTIKEMARRIIEAFRLMDRPKWNSDMLLQAIKLAYFPYTTEISDKERIRNTDRAINTENFIRNAQVFSELEETFKQEDGLRWMKANDYYIFGAFLQRNENARALVKFSEEKKTPAVVGVPSTEIIEKFRLEDNWKEKLRKPDSYKFILPALAQRGQRGGCSHKWNPAKFGEILIAKKERNRTAVSAVIFFKFPKYEDEWQEIIGSTEKGIS